jgi:hypothetical protein
VLMHPGVNLTSQNDVWPRDLASIVIRIPDLIRRGASNQVESSRTYLFDLSDSKGSPLFLGGMQINHSELDDESPTLTSLPDIQLDELLAMSDRYLAEDITVANKKWTVVVVALPGTYVPDIIFVVLGGCIIWVASLCLAAWVWSNTKRVNRDIAERARTESEKTALILGTARQAAKAERELVRPCKLAFCGLLVSIARLFLIWTTNSTLRFLLISNCCVRSE